MRPQGPRRLGPRLRRTLAWAGLVVAGGAAQAQNTLDDRGFVDVWALRAAVAQVEARQPVGAVDPCDPQSDGEPGAPAQVRARERTERRCIARLARDAQTYDRLRQQFNERWRPALRQAIGRGDLVAEVIWRQCSTTPVLDRRGLASTCEDDPARAQAARRLREIGFEAAFEPAFERAMKDTAPDGPSVQDTIANEVVRAEARRVFVLDPLVQNQLESLVALRLNRQPAVPGNLTFGESIESDGDLHVDRHRWREGLSPPTSATGEPARRPGTLSDRAFLLRLRDDLVAADARVDAWLRRDPRWGVFLLRRVGGHEWVPERIATRSGQLDAAWLGEWTLVRHFENFRAVPVGAEPPVRARILRGDGDGLTLLQWENDPASGQSASCRLRYSGGKTLLPADGPNQRRHDVSVGSSVLGDLTRLSATAPEEASRLLPAFEPLDPQKVYRQVLVQCPQGEWADAPRARHLFLAGDVMVEISHEAHARAPLVVRHWQRARLPGAAWPAVPPLPVEPAASPLIARLERLAQVVEVPTGSLRQAPVADLLDLLEIHRLDTPRYGTRAWPAALEVLVERPQAALPACERLRARPADPLVRLSLLAVVHQLAFAGRIPADDHGAAAACARASLDDTHPWVRAEARWALAKLARPEDAAPVQAGLADVDPDVASAAQEALAYFQMKTAPRR